MAFNITTMIYVQDVAKIADFFQSIGFELIEQQEICNFPTIVLAPSRSSNARLQLFNIEFIRKVSPDVASNKPSLLFSVDNIEAFHEKVTKLTPTACPLSDRGGKLTFNFADPEGNYYAFMSI